MNRLVRAITLAYRLVLRLYPAAVQSEYGAEMTATFTEACRDAAGDSIGSLFKTGLIEFRDLPGNLIREHWTNGWRNHVNTPLGPARSLPQSARRGALVFGASFFLVHLVYCLINVLSNSGKTIGEIFNLWQSLNDMCIYPTALACGMGALFLGIGINRKRVYRSALACFLGYPLVAVLTGFLIDGAPSMYNFVAILLFQNLFMALAGLAVGGGTGLALTGWKHSGRYALVGMAGFTLGWFVDKTLVAIILILSPYHSDLNQVVIGSFTYFVYSLVPVLFYGSLVGLFLGMAAFKKAEPPLVLA